MRSCSPWTDDDHGRWLIIDGLEDLPTGADAWMGMVVWDATTDTALQYRGPGQTQNALGSTSGGWQIIMQPSTTYTPTLTNVTIVGGTLSFQYHIMNGYLELSGRYTVGAGDTISGMIGISSPVDSYGASYAADTTVPRVASWGYVHDAAPVANYPAWVTMGSGSRLDVYVLNAAAAASMNITATSSTVPITFAAGDWVQVGAKYRLASLRQW